jgi:hypothetical protein
LTATQAVERISEARSLFKAPRADDFLVPRGTGLQLNSQQPTQTKNETEKNDNAIRQNFDQPAAFAARFTA